MKIGIVGAGKMGLVLGAKWRDAGHSVTFGVRDPGKGEGRDVAAAIGASDVVVLSIPGKAMESFVDAHAQLLAGKVIIDPTNKIGEPTLNSISAVAKVPGHAGIIRAFSHYGWEVYARKTASGAVQFYCSTESDEVVGVANTLIADVGLTPVRVGDLAQGWLVDSALHLWFALAVGQGHGRDTGFGVSKC